MPIESIHTYLVYPNKGVADPAAIVGSQVPHEGDMFALMKSVYEKADTECNIGIAFNKSNGGAQDNARRNMLTAYASAPAVDLGRSLAEELRARHDPPIRPWLAFPDQGQGRLGPQGRHI